jgi:hypothetical protein
MRIRTILAAAAAPAALAAVLLGTAGQASAAVTTASAPTASFWQPNGHALGGPQKMPDGTVAFGGGYLAKVTEKVNNLDIRDKTITINGHLNPSSVQYQNPNSDAGSDVYARVYFDGSSGGTSDQSPQGYMGQPWWARPDSAVVHLNTYNANNGDFSLTVKADPTADWSNWNGGSADQNADLFSGAASHVREIGLSFGGGWFFENGVTGTGSLHIDSIQVDGHAV